MKSSVVTTICLKTEYFVLLGLVLLLIHTTPLLKLLVICNESTYVTVFGKTNRSARKSIIACAREHAFEHEDVNGNEEKENCFTRRRSVGLASNLDGGIFARHKRYK